MFFLKKNRFDFRGALCVGVSALLVFGAAFNTDLAGEAGAKLLSFCFGKSEEAAQAVGSMKKVYYADGGIELDTGLFTVASAAKSGVYETPADIQNIMKEAESKYAAYKKTGEIREELLGANGAAVRIGNATFSNKADEELDYNAIAKQTPSFGKIVKDKNKPYVIIYHTHTTEGYELLDKGWYSDDYNSRTEDASRTVVRVGDEIAARLREAGYGVIHDTNIYDRSYDGAYDRSEVTLRRLLKENPTVAVTLDVHRDAIHYDNGTKCKPTAVVNGKKAAQVMIITGCEGCGVTGFPDWRKNLVFAVALQNEMYNISDTLMRPIFFCHRRYNMDVTPCSLLLEFGTDANTLEEAVYSGSLVGEGLAALLDKNMG